MRIPRIPYSPLLLGPWMSLGLGFLANFLVMAANHGTMPVLVPGGCPVGAMLSEIHSCMSHASHLKFLADWLIIRGFGIASPGDMLEWAGDATWLPALCAWVALVLKDYNDAKNSYSLLRSSWDYRG